MATGIIEDFKKFIMRGNVIDLAVGVVIGAAFTGIVDSLVKDMFNPFLGLLIGGIDFSNMFVTLKGQHYATLKAAQDAGAVTFNYGVFLNQCIKFLIVAFVVFLIVKGVNKLMLQHKKEEAAAPAAPSKQEVLLTEIRDILKTK